MKWDISFGRSVKGFTDAKRKRTSGLEQVGVLEDDHGRLAAKLKRNDFEVRSGGELLDDTTGPSRTY